MARDPLAALKHSLAEQCAALRGVAPDSLPGPLLDLAIAHGPGGVLYVRPRDWEALRHEEGGAGRGVPYWARPWPSGTALAGALADDPPGPRTTVIELGCGLGLPSIVAARHGASVLATDGVTDAVAFAAHGMALNGVTGDVAHADWAEHGDVLVERGPWQLVLAADVLYTRANVEAALRLLPRLVAPDGEVLLADPGRAGARDFLAAARGAFELRTRRAGDVNLHRLRPVRRPPPDGPRGR